MKKKVLFGGLAIAALLAGVCSSGSMKIETINSLSSEQDNNGSIRGLEKSARFNPKTQRREINILFTHGIGWTEKEGGFALDFIESLASHYGDTYKVDDLADTCPKSGKNAGGVRLSMGGEPLVFETDISGRYLFLTDIACVDKLSYVAPNDVTYNFYRVLWDDLFWNGLHFKLIGYDDTILPEIGTPRHTSRKRAFVNSKIKDQLITHGFSDAMAYTGAAGEAMRAAVSGAMCLVISDIYNGDFQTFPKVIPRGHRRLNFRVAEIEDVCDQAYDSIPDRNEIPLNFVSESFGSRVIFDVLSGAAPNYIEDFIDESSNFGEIFMLANQLPLLSLGRLERADEYYQPREGYKSEWRNEDIWERDKFNLPKIINISEVNDPLGYEIVPYFEFLWQHGTTQNILDCEDTEPGVDEGSYPYSFPPPPPPPPPPPTYSATNPNWDGTYTLLTDQYESEAPPQTNSSSNDDQVDTYFYGQSETVDANYADSSVGVTGSRPQNKSCPELREKLRFLNHLSSAGRNELTQTLGFEVVDIRARYATPIPLFVSPARSHLKLAQSKKIMSAIVCGVESGQVLRTNNHQCID